MPSVAVLAGSGSLLPLGSWQSRRAGRAASFVFQVKREGCLVSKSNRFSDSGCDIYQGGGSMQT